MNIAVDIRHLALPNPSGVGYYTKYLVEEMARLAPNDTFFLFATGTPQTLAHTPTFVESNIRVIKRAIPNKLFKLLLLLPGGPKMESFLPEKPDVWLFPDSNIVKTRLPYVITVHDMSFELFKEFFSRSQLLRHRIAGTRKLIRHARHILAVSRSTKRDITQLLHVDEEKISVTHLGVSRHLSPRVEPSDKNYLREHGISSPYLLTLSTLEPRKNLASVVEAYSAWRAQTNESHPPSLVIAGGAGWKSMDLTKALIESDYRKDILLTGYVPDKHKGALYRGARAFFFPSFYEGFGLPALEAMACGTPVVTTFTGSLPEVVGAAAVTVDPYNVRDLEQVLEQLENVEFRTALSESGTAQASRFSWETTAKKTLSILNQIGC